VGHSSGSVQQLDSTLLSADNTSHGRSRCAVQHRGCHGQWTDQVSVVVVVVIVVVIAVVVVEKEEADVLSSTGVIMVSRQIKLVLY